MTALSKLSPSLENYLEAIYRIVAEKRAARGRDIADRIDVSRSSVTGALRSLASKGMINYAPYDIVTLTEAGEKVAREIVRRHEVLRRFLVEVLSIDGELAGENACRMEHVLDKKVLRRLSSFMEFVKACPGAGEDCGDKFRDYFRSGGDLERDDAPLEKRTSG